MDIEPVIKQQIKENSTEYPVVHLLRNPSTDEGTPGVLVSGTGFLCRTIECPNRGNTQDLSCIPRGIYKANIIHSNKYGTVYEVKDVLNRTKILIHWGNWAGDVLKGYRTDSKGCILLGDRFMHIFNQNAVAKSKSTYKRFMKHMDNKPFKLIIEDI